ncbi:MAG: type 1 glutamine amidotransferase [Pararhodobacter sp.]
MHIAFLDANTDRSALAARHPGEAEKFRQLLHPVAAGMQLTDFCVAEGVFPETLQGFDGVMISGSPASVNHDDDWITRLKALIRQAVSDDVPVFGACFGHQAVATALGGRVGPNPQGWVLGRAETANHSPGPWMVDAPAVMALHAAHNEQVLQPPPGARVLGGTAGCPVGQMAVGARVYSTQYHPEITRAFMDDLLGELVGTVPDAVLQEARAGLEGPEHSALMARWIHSFFAQARS